MKRSGDWASSHLPSLALLLPQARENTGRGGQPHPSMQGSRSIEMHAVHTLKVRLKVVGGTEARLELRGTASLSGSGRASGRGTWKGRRHITVYASCTSPTKSDAVCLSFVGTNRSMLRVTLHSQ